MMSQMRMKLREGLSEGMEEFLPRATLELESEGKTKTGVDDLLRKRESQGQRAADEPSTALNKNGAAGTPKLTRIAELILGVDARAIAFEDKEGAEEETRNQARKQLAASLGCTLPDLDSVVDSYGIAWQEMVLEERIRLGIDSAPIRDASWDRLESAVLRKLIHLVDKKPRQGSG